jgi:hypothetical protein
MLFEATDVECHHRSRYSHFGGRLGEGGGFGNSYERFQGGKTIHIITYYQTVMA